MSDRSLRLTVNHWSKKGPKEIGQCITTFAQLKEMKESGEDVEFVLINEEKKNGKKADTYENSGIVKLVYFKKKKERRARPKRTKSKLSKLSNILILMYYINNFKLRRLQLKTEL